MTIWFIAVRNNLRADGFLIANGEVFVARSGRNVADVPLAERQKVRANGKVHNYAAERGDIPPGTYLMGPATGLSTDNKLTMTSGEGDLSRFRKFAIMNPRGGNEVVDPRYVKGAKTDKRIGPRTDLRFHFDGDVEGSEGCIIYDDERAQAALVAAYGKEAKARTPPGVEVRVEHFGTHNEVRARVAEITGKPAPG